MTTEINEQQMVVAWIKVTAVEGYKVSFESLPLSWLNLKTTLIIGSALIPYSRVNAVSVVSTSVGP